MNTRRGSRFDPLERPALDARQRARRQVAAAREDLLRTTLQAAVGRDRGRDAALT